MQAFARSFRSMLLSHIGVAVASALLLSLMLSSLYWRMCHDAVLTAYPSMLIVKYGILPYRDLFVFNMVGTYGLYCLMGATLGFSDLAFRFTDIALLSLVLLFTYQAQKRYGMKSAVMGAVLFGILYLCDGPKTSMQREFLILLPLSASLWIVHSRRSGWASFLLGVCCGIAASIKPHAVLLWVPVGIYQMTRERHGWRHAGLLVLGSTLPVAGVILML
ncbi:MAG: hypothetical protein KDK78_00910, partial [Chlamydiia bacterium]|nr:hypothetical protein [Chlamydiia bacterium]